MIPIKLKIPCAPHPKKKKDFMRIIMARVCTLVDMTFFTSYVSIPYSFGRRNHMTVISFSSGLSFYTSEKTLRAAFEGFGELLEGRYLHLCVYI